MLTFTNLALRRGSQLLFANVSFTIGKGAKVGLVGANGSGKTSLFQMITGIFESDEGNFDLPKGTRLAYMEQETSNTDQPAVNYVLEGDIDFVSISEALAKAEKLERFEQVAELHEAMAAIDGYAARARAEKLMIGLGFKQEELQQPVSAFSGGWQIRLNLARTLMKPSDLLLLDEPTNHLDLDTILWLSDWINHYTGTLLLISHDRAFLDECVDQIAYLHQQSIELFPGNYSQFETIKAARLAEQQSNYARQQREIEHMQDFIRRFRAKATKARQAQSRLKALARMAHIAPAHIDSPFRFEIPSSGKISDPLITLEDAELGYDHAILKDIRLNLHPGDRLGLLGHNGAGKSTLMRSLAGQLNLMGGKLIFGTNLKRGYYSQQQVENLHLEQSAFIHIQSLNENATEQRVRDYLGGYDFRGDRISEPVASFSGGEKARLALAIIAYQEPNVLLLDEPTNHLDMEMCQALTIALQEFPGAIVLISHDRHILANTVDEFLLVDDGGVQRYAGDLQDYRAKLFGEKPIVSPPAAIDKPKPTTHKAARQLRTKIKTLDQRLERLSRKLADIETRLSNPDIYTRDQGVSVQQLLKDQLELKSQIEDIETQWLDLSAQLETHDKS
ncbi:MAG TPA: ABC transporter ATP-binding protein [Gammaproteobacteria bacterium]|nr:ABC transporter ATP-binding protein [Gammaproteobacteria bacterium]